MALLFLEYLKWFLKISIRQKYFELLCSSQYDTECTGLTINILCDLDTLAFSVVVLIFSLQHLHRKVRDWLLPLHTRDPELNQ